MYYKEGIDIADLHTTRLALSHCIFSIAVDVNEQVLGKNAEVVTSQAQLR